MNGRGGRQRIPRPPTVRAGGPPPWAHLFPEARHLTLADVRARCADLSTPKPPPLAIPGSRAAAVLLPLFEEGGEARLVLTKRPESMPSHQGEIAFPGGKVHVGLDATPCDAALREAEEEIGLSPSAVEVIAELDTIATVASRFTITPFVGVLDGRPVLSPHPGEVVKIFDVALSELLADGVYRAEYWDNVPDRAVYFFELHDETVWGATARILAAFLAHLIAGR